MFHTLEKLRIQQDQFICMIYFTINNTDASEALKLIDEKIVKIVLNECITD